jgi:hypothetical protein
MAMRASLTSLIILLACALQGCASYTSWTSKQASLADCKRIWVDNNLSDNHRIELMLVEALKVRGISAESGPPTMRSDQDCFVLSYRDHWSWDFSEHLTALELELRDVKLKKMLATATYSGPASMRTSPQEAVNRLLAEIFANPKAAKPTQP